MKQIPWDFMRRLTTMLLLLFLSTHLMLAVDSKNLSSIIEMESPKDYRITSGNTHTLTVEVNGWGGGVYIDQYLYSFDEEDDFGDEHGIYYWGEGDGRKESFTIQDGCDKTLYITKIEKLYKAYLNDVDITDSLKIETFQVTEEFESNSTQLWSEFNNACVSNSVYYIQLKNIKEDVHFMVVFCDFDTTIDEINYVFRDSQAFVAANREYVDDEPWNPMFTDKGAVSTYAGHIAIPSEIEYDYDKYAVTEIGPGAFIGANALSDGFNRNESIYTVDLPSSIKKIRSRAFMNCKNISFISLPRELEFIGDEAFSGCELNAVKVNGTSPIPISADVFPDRKKCTLYVPKGCASKYQKAEIWKDFKKIDEKESQCKLTFAISGDGFVKCKGEQLSNTTKTFTLNEGETTIFDILPARNYQVEKFIINGEDGFSYKEGLYYIIKNPSKDYMVEIVFSSVPFATITMRTIGEGAITIGEWMEEEMPGGGFEEFWYIDDGIGANQTRFISYPVGTHLNLMACSQDKFVKLMANGKVVPKDNIQVFESDDEFGDGFNYMEDFDLELGIYDFDCGHEYDITLNEDMEFVALFEEKMDTIIVDGINYGITSRDKRFLKVLNGNYGGFLTLPTSFWLSGIHGDVPTGNYKVKSIGDNAFCLCPELRNVTIPNGIDTIGKGLFIKSDHIAALQWENNQILDDETMGEVDNPNFLLYVENASQNKTSVKNVIVDGKIENLMLVDTKEGGDFFCPKEFFASNACYIHQYGMQSGMGEPRGWETIALPFDVMSITHDKGTLVPFAAYKGNNNTKPFWLYEYSAEYSATNGWAPSYDIKAYKPYIICMPNNDDYNDMWNISGEVTFSANNVQMRATGGLMQNTYNGRKFSPAYSYINKQDGIFALNVHNTFSQNNSEYLEGSHFINNLRGVHPFEAYMTSTNGTNAPIGIFDDLPTDIPDLLFMAPGEVSGTGDSTPLRVTTLSGQVVREVAPGGSLDNATRGLPAGVYIVGNRKVVVR